MNVGTFGWRVNHYNTMICGVLLVGPMYFAYTRLQSVATQIMKTTHLQKTRRQNTVIEKVHPLLSDKANPQQYLNASLQSNLNLTFLLQNHSARNNWKALVGMGYRMRDSLHSTVFDQCLSSCANSYASSQLLFPLLWEHMEVWTLLNQMKHFWKNATQYGVRVSTSKFAIKQAFEVSNESFDGYIMIIVIPSTSDFQCLVMTYSHSFQLNHQAVLTRAGILKGSRTVQLWKNANGDKQKLPNLIHTKQQNTKRPINVSFSKAFNIVSVHTEENTIRFPFVFDQRDASDKPQLRFSTALPLHTHHSFS